MTGRNLWIAIGVAAVVCVVIAIVWLGGSLNAIVRSGVERYGPEITGTPVRLAGVDLRLREARGSLRELRIGNPEGFSGNDAVSLGEITLALDARSLTKEPIVIDTLRVTGPSLRLEVSDDGKVNLRSIQHNVERYGPAKGDGGKGGIGDHAASKKPPRVAVRTLSVEGGKIQVDTRAVGGKLSEKTLGGFTLHDLGGADGVPADELGQEVLRAVLREALRSTAADEVKQKAKDRLKDEAGKLLNKLH